VARNRVGSWPKTNYIDLQIIQFKNRFSLCDMNTTRGLSASLYFLKKVLALLNIFVHSVETYFSLQYQTIFLIMFIKSSTSINIPNVFQNLIEYIAEIFYFVRKRNP